ncbi:polyphosphate:AMP phosphotransferase [Pseudomonas fluorescens]|uniref:Polyphosphate:AMP phosphotransferase n=1 Tax=Pseudomonas fluorescens TaxID=294 RepID=A0A5E6SPR8_PSEFL|nr:polyphosphate:AMP phosphotransferase [Pseudomonas fluorescens]VVM78018.1 Polyphosphate:AMP phosphotransferase [Pseudomonas fluorescens]
MFESAEIGHAIDKDTYEAAVPALREALPEAQFDLQMQRRLEVGIFDQRDGEELARAPEWRYWRMLPAKGRMGIFFVNWYSQMLQGRVNGLFKDPRLDQAIAGAERLEKMLCDEGALIFKFWFHLSKKQMKARLKALADDPLHSWRISPLDWQQSETYDKFVKYGERVLRRTSRDYAPWHVIEGADANYRSLAVGKILLEGLQSALKRPDVHPHDVSAAPLGTPVDQLNLLDSLDLTQRLEKKDYEEQLITEQARLSGLMRDKRMRREGRIAVFEGNDAAGKGGAIRRVAAALDPRQYNIVPIAAPTEEERAQPYLWRFWRHIPARGKFTVFDRSWYGRVLVERVEGFCTPADWLRAYGEINDFEEQLADAGVIVVKFWLAIDKETQMERFQAREEIPFKRFKITEDDWRNRDKWDDYRAAVGDMVDRTSSEISPWTLVEANDKRWARVKVLRTINHALEEAFEKSDKHAKKHKD